MAEEVAAAVIAGRAPAAVVAAPAVADPRCVALVAVAAGAGLRCVGAEAAVARAGKVAEVGAGILIATSKVVVAGQSWGGGTTAVFGTGLVDGVFGAGNGIPTA